VVTVVIDFYDSGVLISDGNYILANSLSYALIEANNSIVVGDLAEQQAHLRPREISTQFWGNLSANSKTKHVVSNAELAFKHLQFVWGQVCDQNYTVVLATPNTLSKQDLGLLLGICKKLSVPVRGIVSKAVLALKGPVADSMIVYLDVLQQQIVITEIIQKQESISSSLVNTTSSHGLQSLTRHLASTIAEQFITETRFDPIHMAEDEQQFFEKLTLWLKILASNESVKCVLSSNKIDYSITLHKELVLNSNYAAFCEISACLLPLLKTQDKDNITIICSQTCAQVFGFTNYLETLPGCAVIRLDKNNIAKQALQYIEQIEANDSQVHYTTSLSWDQSLKPLLVQFNAGSLPNLNKNPDHLLIDNHAYPITQELFLEINNSGFLTIGNTCNDNSVCKISKHGLLIKVARINGHNINFNNKLLETQKLATIGDHLSINKNTNALYFIKVNKYETQTR